MYCIILCHITLSSVELACRIDKILNSDPLDTIMEDELVDMGEQGRVVEEEGGFDEESREKYTTNENGNEHETRSDVEEKDSVGSPAICGEVVDNKGGMGRALLGEDFEGQEATSSSQGLSFRPGKIAKE